MYIITNFLLLAVVLISCGQVNKNQTNTMEVEQLEETESTMVNNNEKFTFIYNNDVVLQKLDVTFIEDNQISFAINVKEGGCKTSIVGEAVDNYPDSDPALDEDEEGYGYPAIEYVYQEKNCIVVIRIEMQNKDKAKVIFKDCEVLFGDCKVTSGYLLRPE